MGSTDITPSPAKAERKTKPKPAAGGVSRSARAVPEVTLNEVEQTPAVPAVDASFAAQASGAAPLSSAARYTEAEWRAMVAEAAYLRAERRGFVRGSPEQDWFEAEEELRLALGDPRLA
jgi:hypothetical protein